jgi:hypothetical protein
VERKREEVIPSEELRDRLAFRPLARRVQVVADLGGGVDALYTSLGYFAPVTTVSSGTPW